MKHPLFYLSLIGGTILLGFVGIILSVDPMGRWRFRPQPSIPPNATQIATFHPSNEVQRIIQFKIPPSPADQIQQFYRTELPKQGWSYRCTVKSLPDAGLELMEVYEQRKPQSQDGQSLLVEIKKQGALDKQTQAASRRNRFVQVTEWLRILPADRSCTPK